MIELKRIYDYENLLQRFQKMNNFKIRLEYARVLNDIAFLEKFLALNQLTEKEYFAHIEPLDNAKSFLEGYLARSVLASKGFTTEDGTTWEYYRGDRNLLSPRKSEKQKARAEAPNEPRWRVDEARSATIFYSLPFGTYQQKHGRFCVMCGKCLHVAKSYQRI